MTTTVTDTGWIVDRAFANPFDLSERRACRRLEIESSCRKQESSDASRGRLQATGQAVHAIVHVDARSWRELGNRTDIGDA